MKLMLLLLNMYLVLYIDRCRCVDYCPSAANERPIRTVA
jgi:hypothetical protein